MPPRGFTDHDPDEPMEGTEGSSPIVASDEVYTQLPVTSAGTPEPTQFLEEMTPAKDFTVVPRRRRHWLMIPASAI
ncbi:hypothetical protein BGZ54_005820, partial [Gamsiella multidivaricata]